MNRKNRDFPAVRRTDFREGFSLQGDTAMGARCRRVIAPSAADQPSLTRMPDAGMVGPNDRAREWRASPYYLVSATFSRPARGPSQNRPQTLATPLRQFRKRKKETPLCAQNFFAGGLRMSALALCVQPVSATPLVVYRLAFGSPRSFADVD